MFYKIKSSYTLHKHVINRSQIYFMPRPRVNVVFRTILLKYFVGLVNNFKNLIKIKFLVVNPYLLHLEYATLKKKTNKINKLFFFILLFEILLSSLITVKNFKNIFIFLVFLVGFYQYIYRNIQISSKKLFLAQLQQNIKRNVWFTHKVMNIYLKKKKLNFLRHHFDEIHTCLEK